jgi:hypothetical protein
MAVGIECLMKQPIEHQGNPNPRGLVLQIFKFEGCFITKRPHFFSFCQTHLYSNRNGNRLGNSELRPQCEAVGQQRGSQDLIFSICNANWNANIGIPPASSKPLSIKLTRGRYHSLSPSRIYPFMIINPSGVSS